MQVPECLVARENNVRGCKAAGGRVVRRSLQVLGMQHHRLHPPALNMPRNLRLPACDDGDRADDQSPARHAASLLFTGDGSISIVAKDEGEDLNGLACACSSCCYKAS